VLAIQYEGVLVLGAARSGAADGAAVFKSCRPEPRLGPAAEEGVVYSGRSVGGSQQWEPWREFCECNAGNQSALCTRGRKSGKGKDQEEAHADPHMAAAHLLRPRWMLCMCCSGWCSGFRQHDTQRSYWLQHLSSSEQLQARRNVM
jgi:hypothetical protein